MIDVEKIYVSYGESRVLFGVSMNIAKGEIVSLVGPNGAGKTTLMRALSGLTEFDKGRILFNGKNIGNISAYKRVEMGLIHVPEGRKLFPDMTVKSNLEMGAYSRRARDSYNDTLEEVLSIFPLLRTRLFQKAGTMSGGEQQMLAIARGLMGHPSLLMLDEVSLGLSPIMTTNIFNTLREINKRSKCAIFIVEQNVKKAFEISIRSYVLREGRIIKEGASNVLNEDPEVKMAYLGI